MVEQRLIGCLQPFVGHHVAQRPTRFGLIALRRAVVDMNRFANDRQLFLRQTEHASDFFLRRRSAQFFAQSRRRPTPLAQQFNHISRDADRLCTINQRSLDRLLDPIARIRAEASSNLGIKAFNSAQQPKISLFDQVLQPQPLAGVSPSDIDHQSQVGSDHSIACSHVALCDSLCQFEFFGRRQQRGLVDFSQVGLQWRLGGTSRFSRGLASFDQQVTVGISR